MPYAIPHWVWLTVVGAVVAAAAWRGDTDARIDAAALVVAVLLTKLVYAHQGQQTEWGVLAVDCGALAVFVAVALRSRNFWPLFVAGFQLLAVIIHLARTADPTLTGWTYISAEILFGYMVAFTIGGGALRGRPYPSAEAAARRGTRR